MTWQTWLHGLGAAIAGGAVGGFTQASQAGASLKGTGLSAAGGAIVTVLAYFLKSPLFQGVTIPPPAV